jgi:hypothetical protein
MKISRRVFLFSGLILVSGLFYWKKHTITANDLELFFSNYESAIPIDESIYNISNEISLFEKELLSMLSSIGVVKTITIVNQNIIDEYQSGKIKLMNGWIVSETEFCVLALRQNYV